MSPERIKKSYSDTHSWRRVCVAVAAPDGLQWWTWWSFSQFEGEELWFGTWLRCFCISIFLHTYKYWTAGTVWEQRLLKSTEAKKRILMPECYELGAQISCRHHKILRALKCGHAGETMSLKYFPDDKILHGAYLYYKKYFRPQWKAASAASHQLMKKTAFFTRWCFWFFLAFVDIRLNEQRRSFLQLQPSRTERRCWGIQMQHERWGGGWRRATSAEPPGLRSTDLIN